MQNRLFSVVFFTVLSAFIYCLPVQAKDTDHEHISASAESSTLEERAATSLHKTTVSSSALPTRLASDVRLLVDISGSMKQTDPRNLRKPAMDLIVRLLPEKSRAGVWTFGNAVNMLVPFKPVDTEWRKQAVEKSTAINSIAMFTNIGKALDDVSFDKSGLNQDYKTHIILLTDGVVDISKDAVVNFKERQRILNEILPNLKSAGYIVHTIALSESSDVDLLKKLSYATDGVYTLVASADQLMSVFLKIFDQAVPAERVPLENNGFLVDASIKEFTALIFRKPGTEKTIINSPDAKDYSATNLSAGINWYRTDKYDLITVTSPKAGQWKIKTEIAPESRVTIVSNLQFVVAPLKSNLHSNDVIGMTYSFQENGRTITDANFLGLISVNALVAKKNLDESSKFSFGAPMPPADGVFHEELNAFNASGDYDIHVFVDGKTFKREFKHALSVRDSLMVVEKNTAADAAGQLIYNYKISTDAKLVDVTKTHLSATVTSSPKEPKVSVLTLVDDHYWAFSFSPENTGDYEVAIHAQGELLNGDVLDETLTADKFTYAAKSVEHASPVVPPLEESAPVTVEPAESSNMLLYVGIGVGNLLLLLIGFFAYKFIMGGKAKEELVAAEKILSAVSNKDKKKIEEAPTEQKVEDKKLPEKTEIDLTDDSMHIPMNEDSTLEDLFPLDSMEDPSGPDDRN